MKTLQCGFEKTMTISAISDPAYVFTFSLILKKEVTYKKHSQCDFHKSTFQVNTLDN